MSTKRARIIIGASAAGLLVLAGCSDTEGQDHSSMTEMVTTTSIAAPSSAADMGEHNAADMTFAQEMISHHSQAITMSNILLDKNDINPEVVRLAQQIKAAQQPEIDQMKSWVTTWGASMSSSSQGHDMGQMSAGESMSPSMGGHDMPGMMTEQQLQQLREAQGTAAARLYLTQMIEHHRGAVAMAKTEIQDGKNPEAIALARKIISDQESEIAEMQRLLAGL